MRILPLFVLLVCLAWQATARPQDDSEPRPVQSRGLLKRGLVGKGKPTTTSTTLAPEEEGDYEEDGDYPAEAEAQEPSTETPASSTEGKKLVAGGVRPFRSNTDLLEALKRRRAQVAEAKLGHSVSADSQSQDVQTETPVKANYSKKRFNTATRETKSEDVPPAPPAPAKPNRGRFGRPTSRSFQETEPVEEQNDSAPTVRTGRQFRRGGN